MNQVTYLIFVILFVYGTSEIVYHNKSQPKNDNKTNNSIKIMTNNFVNVSKSDAFIPSSEGSPDFVKYSLHSETSKPNSSEVFVQILKINDNNLTSSETKDVELTSISRSSAASPTLSTRRTSRNGTTINKELTFREKSDPRREETTTKIFVFSASTSNISVSSTNMQEVKPSTKIFISSEAGVAETTAKIFVPSDSEVVETTRTLSSKSSAITSASPTNLPKMKSTTKRKEATTNTFVSSEVSAVKIEQVFHSESNAITSTSPSNLPKVKSTTKRKETTTNTFASSEEGVVKITKALLSESTETTTSPLNNSSTDTKSLLMTTTTKQMFPATVSAQTIPTATFQRLVHRRPRQELTLSEDKEISCAFQYCKLLSKEYLENRKPALCKIGRHGSRCSYSCFNCLGKLCQTSGQCLFGKLPKCDNFECRQGLGLVNTFQLEEISGSVEVFYNGPESYNIKLIYWTYKENKLENGGVQLLTKRLNYLPIKYNCKFIVCLFLFENNILRNVECQVININSKCIGFLKKVKFSNNLLVWEKKNRVDLFHYGVYYSFQNGVCGTPVKEFSIHTNSTSYAYPNMKGTWEVCVVGERQVHDRSCDSKKTCLIHDFGQENVTVVDLAIEFKDPELQISWTFPESWNTNCGNFIFKLSLKVEDSLQQEKSLNTNSCIRKRCSFSFYIVQPGLYNVEVTPIFDNSIDGSTSNKSIYIIKCPQAVVKIVVESENEKLLIKWRDYNDDIKELFYNVSIENHELCKIPDRTISSSVKNKKEFTFPENESTSFGYVIKVEPLVKGCSSPTFIRSITYQTDKKVSFLLENLNASLIEESVNLSWKIPTQWKNICVIKYFQILIFKYFKTKNVFQIVDQKNSSPSQICDDLTCTYIWNSYLEPFTRYSFLVYAVFTNNALSNSTSVSIVTPEAYPEIPEDAVIKTVEGKRVIIRYNFKSYLDSLLNMSCMIGFHDVNSRDNKTFDCSDGNGKFEEENFKKGMHYNVSVTICNSRSCKREPRLLDFGTPPEKPIFMEPVSYSPSGKNKITLTFPSYNDQQEGKIYIVVVKGSSSTLNKSFIEDFVEQFQSTKEVPTRLRSSIEDAKSFDLYIVDVVDIKTKEYELNSEKVFKENEIRRSIYVAAVFAPEAGEFRSFGSTQITGKIAFPTAWEPREVEGIPPRFIWQIVGLVVLICTFIALSIYLKRHITLVRKTSAEVSFNNRSNSFSDIYH